MFPKILTHLLFVANRLWHFSLLLFVALLTFTFCGKPFANRAALKSALPPTEATNIGLWTPQILLQPLYKLSHLFRIILCKYIQFQPNFLFDLQQQSQILGKCFESLNTLNISIDWQYQSASNFLKVNTNQGNIDAISQIDICLHVYLRIYVLYYSNVP